MGTAYLLRRRHSSLSTLETIALPSGFSTYVGILYFIEREHRPRITVVTCGCSIDRERRHLYHLGTIDIFGFFHFVVTFLYSDKTLKSRKGSI